MWRSEAKELSNDQTDLTNAHHSDQDPDLGKNTISLSQQDVVCFEGFGLVKNTNPTGSRPVNCGPEQLVSIFFMFI
ncbi:hypothetical protein VP01_922g4 [Puccinia sorghi]|uniref:Uncharacterized protein n=1 Tax=Puccinia sorghi TaxID=27349 RepID=A0A0L6U7A2_9BASI|nr:hypothetical protein VP01_922g4 [Puccinia sorghi]